MITLTIRIQQEAEGVVSANITSPPSAATVGEEKAARRIIEAVKAGEGVVDWEDMARTEHLN